MAVTLNKVGNNANRITLEIYGKSSDTKPIDFIETCPIINGSIFIEMDTGNAYFFDEETHTWIPA